MASTSALLEPQLRQPFELVSPLLRLRSLEELLLPRVLRC